MFCNVQNIFRNVQNIQGVGDPWISANKYLGSEGKVKGQDYPSMNMPQDLKSIGLSKHAIWQKQ